MTPPPDKTLEELASKLRSPGCAADFLDLIEYLRRKANNPQDYIPEAVADAKHDLELLSATADLRAEVERLRRNAIVSHLMQGELETQLATERERNENIAKFGRLLVGELIQGEWTPDDEWRDEMVSKGEELGLIGRRQPGEDDDQDLQYIWTNLTTPPSATEGQT
jgi:hypothetical protein